MKRLSILAMMLWFASGVAAVNAAESIRVRNETGALVTVTVGYGGPTRKEEIRPGNDYDFPYRYSNKSANSIHVAGRAINVPRKHQWVCGVSGPGPGTYIVTVSGGRCSVRRS